MKSVIAKCAHGKICELLCFVNNCKLLFIFVFRLSVLLILFADAAHKSDVAYIMESVDVYLYPL